MHSTCVKIRQTVRSDCLFLAKLTLSLQEKRYLRAVIEVLMTSDHVVRSKLKIQNILFSFALSSSLVLKLATDPW